MNDKELRNRILDTARRAFLSRQVPAFTNHPNKDRRFRALNDNGPVGFQMGKVSFEVHFAGEKKGVLHGIKVVVPVIDVLVIKANGDAKVLATRVEVLPCV